MGVSGEGCTYFIIFVFCYFQIGHSALTCCGCASCYRTEGGRASGTRLQEPGGNSSLAQLSAVSKYQYLNLFRSWSRSLARRAELLNLCTRIYNIYLFADEEAGTQGWEISKADITSCSPDSKAVQSYT